jgi:hypothetical protein
MIYHLFLASFFIFGIRVLFLEGMLFGTVRERILEGLPEWVKKPTFACPACMSSVYGTFYFIIMMGGAWPWWLFFIIALAGLNWMIMGLVNRL